MVDLRPMLMSGLMGVGLFACASSFPYKWYGLDAMFYDGTLLGPDSSKDLPLKLCEPADRQRGKCVVVFIDEWERLRADYLATKERLKECEREVRQ